MVIVPTVAKRRLRKPFVYDPELATNAYGREIYVEEWDTQPNRPRVWYEFNRQGVLMKSVRKPSGISTTNLGKTHFLLKLEQA